MRKNYFLTVLVLLQIFFISCSNKPTSSKPQEIPKLRVLGYLFSHGNWATDINSIDLNKVTDINLAFINPDVSGNFSDNDAYRLVIEKAHNSNIRVFLSIGGGDPPAQFAGLMEKDKRPGFIASLVGVAEKYHFDGIDVDIENALINQNYAPFVSELAAAVKTKNKLITAALASWNSNLIHDTTLNKYNFINIMSYDKTGPWNLDKPGPHSPFEMAQNDFTYYNKMRGIAAEKLFIGLPFYGYGFGNGVPQGLSYKDIVSLFPGSENNDSLTVAEGGRIYYNGIPTIKRKVSFAIDNKAGGVMIWQLKGDTNDNRSLLKAINDTKGI